MKISLQTSYQSIRPVALSTRTELPPDKALWMLFASCVLFTAFILWGFQGYYYKFDFFYDISRYVWQAKSLGFLNALMIKDFAFRPHPTFSILFRLCNFLFGTTQEGYLFFGLAFHCISAFILYFLCRSFSTRVFTALLASLLFLTSSLCWGGVTDIIDALVRRPGLLFYMAGILCARKAFITAKPVFFLATVLLCTMSIVTTEDAITFPLILVGLVVLQHAKSDTPIRYLWVNVTILTCSALCAIYTFYILCGGTTSYYSLYFGWHSFQKIIVMPRELLQFLFVPRREWGSDIVWIRLLSPALVLGPIIALLISAPTALKSRFLRESRLLLIFALLWIPFTSVPYLTRPTGWTWISRYLYFPSVGLFILCALFGTIVREQIIAIFPSRKPGNIIVGAIVAYLMIFGVTSSVLIWQNLCLNTERNWVVGKTEASLLSNLMHEIHSANLNKRGKNHILIRNSPFHVSRLHSILAPYLAANIALVDNVREIPVNCSQRYTIDCREGQWSKIATINAPLTSKQIPRYTRDDICN